MEESLGDDGLHLPYYLSQDKKDALHNALKQFPKSFDYSRKGDQAEILQGDAWVGFEAINFNSLKKRSLMGVVLSNSCDVDIENKRDLPGNIIFAPMVRLADFISSHVKEGVDQQRINDKINSIRRQEITDIFFLPMGQHLNEDYVVLLGYLQSMPLKNFSEKVDKTKKFALSQLGFYIFVFKLSFHFCRFHEEVDRA